MKWRKRILSMLLALLMFTSTLPPVTQAAPSVCFTSVNDTIRDLNDETMPFWSDGLLYIPYTAIDDGNVPKELGIYCSYNREKKIVTLYRMRKVLVFDIAAGTVYDNNDQDTLLDSTVIVRGDVAFLPLDTVAKAFSLKYSYLKVDYGYLLRIKSDTVVLSDSKFIDAATLPMTQRYNQYEKAHQNANGTPGGNESSGSPTARMSAYLAFTVDDPAASERMLLFLEKNGHAVTFLFDEAAIEENDDLLRHVVISGSAVALRIDASGGAEQTISAIERANEALWTASNTKTRLVCLDNASDAVIASVRSAGYCPVTFALDYQEKLPSASRAANSILSYAGQGKVCSVYLGSAEQAEKLMTSLASSLRSSGCALARLNEVTA